MDLISEKKRYLVFCLGSMEFGVLLADVLEIIIPPVITHVPYQSNYILGVMNLRGKIVPVIDLKMRFSIYDLKPVKPQAIIVLQQGETLLGVYADLVEEVVQSAEEIQHIEQEQCSHFCSGAICRGKDIIQILDIPMIFKK